MALKNIAADGRDLSGEEWRVLPEFPNYEITADGDVRNKRTQRILKEQDNARSGWYYTLYLSPTKYHARGFWGLIYSAFPELKPVKEKRWAVIPEHPRYEMDKDGVVRIKGTQREMKVFIAPFCDIPYVRLTTNGITYCVKIEDLKNGSVSLEDSYVA